MLGYSSTIVTSFYLPYRFDYYDDTLYTAEGYNIICDNQWNAHSRLKPS